MAADWLQSHQRDEPEHCAPAVATTVPVFEMS
jgi:hypothetical protein